MSALRCGVTLSFIVHPPEDSMCGGTGMCATVCVCSYDRLKPRPVIILYASLEMIYGNVYLYTT
jgi:hypothetical protein